MDLAFAIGIVEILAAGLLALCAIFMFFTTIRVFFGSFFSQAIFNWHETISSLIITSLFFAASWGLYLTGKALPKGTSWADLSTVFFLALALGILVVLTRTVPKNVKKKKK